MAGKLLQVKSNYDATKWEEERRKLEVEIEKHT